MATTEKSATVSRINLTLRTSLVISFILVVLLTVKYTTLRLRIAYADDQITVFSARIYSSDSITNPMQLADQLDYLVHYYPSGTKQDKGTKLDRVVEGTRSIAIAAIITRLRDITGRNLGADPQLWITEYQERSTQKLDRQ
jgi:hypothetical protein